MSQFSSVTQSCPTVCDPVDSSMPGFPVHHQHPELAQTHVIIESVMLSNHLILCHPLFLLPSIFPSIRVFSNESVLCIKWPKYWSFSFSISPSNEYSGLISFRIDWLDLKSLLQHHSSKASILLCSTFFMVQFSIYDYWKSHSFDQTKLCRQSNVSAFYCVVQVCHSFPSKEQASFNFMAAVTICSGFGAQENKVCPCFHHFPICLP